MFCICRCNFMPSLENWNWGGLINISFIVSFRHMHPYISCYTQCSLECKNYEVMHRFRDKIRQARSWFFGLLLRRIRDVQECFKEAPECPEVASELVPDIFEFWDLFLFLFIFLATNIDCKSILQKTLKQSVIFTRIVLPCLCVLFFFSKSSGRNNAKYAFQYTFENNTTQQAKKKKKKKRKNKVGSPSRWYSRSVSHPVPNPARKGLNWVALLKNQVSLGLLRDTYL